MRYFVRREPVSPPRPQGRPAASPLTDQETRQPAWLGFAARLAVVGLVFTGLAREATHLYGRAAWKAALTSIPFREGIVDCGMVGEMRMVGMAGKPVRPFGIDFRYAGPSLPMTCFGESAREMVWGEPVLVTPPYCEMGDDQLELLEQAASVRSLSLDGTR